MIRFGGFKPGQVAAQACARKAGIRYEPPTQYAKVDPARATRIADAFEVMKHEPGNSEVIAAYTAMANEVEAQYEAMLASEIEVDFIDFAKTGDPYGNLRNPNLDVTRNNHLWTFPTSVG
ncbi:MAG: hypothetical protein IPG23_00290 [Burkholderiales bacterium]|nr:hypothetical protein [Burkholderiales bacterium]